jgi:drug/metabolite transporter (DMT)-like permease
MALTDHARTDRDAPATTSLADPATKLAPELAQLVVVMLWASTFIVTKAAFAEVSPLGFIFSRFLLMVALAFAVLLIKERGENLWIARADLGRLLLAGFTGYTLYQLGFVLGLNRTSVFSSALLWTMIPLFTLLILAMMGEPTPFQGWVGLGVAFVGVVVFLLDKRDAAAGALLGDLLTMGAALSFAIYGIINRPLVARYPAATYTAWSLLAGTIPLLLISLPAAMAQNWSAISTPTWAGIVYMAIFPVYIACILWNYAIARRGAAQATSFPLLVPVITGVLAAALFGEPFGFMKLLGAALVLGGLVIIRLPPSWRFRKTAAAS